MNYDSVFRSYGSVFRDKNVLSMQHNLILCSYVPSMLHNLRLFVEESQC